MTSVSARLTASVIGAAVLGGALVGAAALPASAADAAPAPTVKTAAQVRSETIAQYGVFPLPVSTREVSQYKLTKKQIQDIAKAKKLAASSKAKHIRQRESHGNYKINTGNGYYGAYQFDRGTWKTNGGGKFGTTANKAPKWAQDYVMWRTHNARGWQPWGG